MEVVSGEVRKPHNVVYDLRLLLNIPPVIKSSRKKFAGYRARIGSCIVGVPEGKKQLGNSRCMWKYNYKIEPSSNNLGPGLIIYLLAYEDETEKV
jgi:hypothetical protein